jgi:hypothetical protein
MKHPTRYYVFKMRGYPEDRWSAGGRISTPPGYSVAQFLCNYNIAGLCVGLLDSRLFRSLGVPALPEVQE